MKPIVETREALFSSLDHTSSVAKIQGAEGTLDHTPAHSIKGFSFNVLMSCFGELEGGIESHGDSLRTSSRGHIPFCCHQ